MKKFLYIIVLSFIIVSCYPPRIIYTLNDNYFDSSDSIEIKLLKGCATSLDAKNINYTLLLEVKNNSKMIMLDKIKGLYILIDSISLPYCLIDVEGVPCKMSSYMKQNVRLEFKVTDSDCLLYDDVSKNKKHCLKLHLQLRSDNRRNINKIVVLHVIKKKKYVYEN